MWMIDETPAGCVRYNFISCLSCLILPRSESCFSFSSNRESSSGGSTMSYILFVYLFEVVFMILGSIVVATYSRYREFRADAGGARLAGKEAMISSLQALRVLQEIKDPRENPAIAAFKISHQGRKGLLRLFASHPPLEERIERLAAIKDQRI